MFKILIWGEIERICIKTEEQACSEAYKDLVSERMYVLEKKILEVTIVSKCGKRFCCSWYMLVSLSMFLK